MRIELVAIGEELLNGVFTNSNATWLGRQLTLQGLTITRHTVLPDSPNELLQGIREALDRSDLVISTGGLGPTCDDCTRAVAAQLFESPLTFYPELAAELRQRHGHHLLAVEDQATQPAGAHFFLNSVGTAPALLLENPHKGWRWIVLPGVPVEMEAIYFQHIAPYLEHIKEIAAPPTVQLHFTRLAEAAIDPCLRALQAQNPQLHFGIYYHHGVLTVNCSVKELFYKDAAIILQRCVEELSAAYQPHLLLHPKLTIEEAIQQLFLERNSTLAVAESCTGGALAARLTAIPGASQYFCGGFVVYTNSLKELLLDVSSHTLEHAGAVSAATVHEMLMGTLHHTGSKWGIAISGVAGPTGGSTTTPVGTIYAAVGRQGAQPRVWEFHLHGPREAVIEQAVDEVLSALYLEVIADQG